MITLISWNVNGIRAAIRKGFEEWLTKESPDILCLQEIKIQEDKLTWDIMYIGGYDSYFNSAVRPGYSGTAMYFRHKPIALSKGIGVAEYDDEGRVITAEYVDYYVVCVYVPNSKPDLSRLSSRQRWDTLFLQYLVGLEQKKPVIVCGDMNVAHTEIDLARPKDNKRSNGFTQEERNGFSAFIDAGFVDTFRMFCTDGGHYTWWSAIGSARTRNVGWRIDYTIVSSSLRDRIADAFILSDVVGSDHCPVGVRMHE